LSRNQGHDWEGRIYRQKQVACPENSFGAIVSAAESEVGVDGFDDIVELIGKYNQLPRKPARVEEIISFRRESDVEGKISSLMKVIGECI